MKVEFNVAGVTFSDFSKIAHTIKAGDLVEAYPEPTNKYDPNAVALYYKGVMIGYVPRNAVKGQIQNLRVKQLSSYEDQVVGAILVAQVGA